MTKVIYLGLTLQRFGRLDPQGTPRRREAGEQADHERDADPHAEGSSEAYTGCDAIDRGESGEPNPRRHSEERAQTDLGDGAPGDAERDRGSWRT